jgi:hypothetical protein
MRVIYEVPDRVTPFDIVVDGVGYFYDITNSLLKKEEQGRLPVLVASFEPDTLHLHEIVIGRTEK